MAVNFPDSPSNGDTTVINGATYTWDGVKWDTTSFASNVTATYDSPLNLPTTGLTNGDVAWVGGSTNKLYISNGTGWLSATLTNSAPVINSVQDASAGTTPFSLATDGTPTVITIDATDPESFGLTYSYSVTSGALGTTATVSQADNVFTITPGTNDPADAGTFELTFSVYDGINTVTSVADFSLQFVVDFSNTTLAYTLDNPNPYGTSDSDTFGRPVAISSTHAIVGAYLEDDANGNSSGKAYIYDLSNGSLAYTLDNPNPYDTSTNDYFGYSVSISDTYAIVGAWTEDDAGGADSGKAYIYDLSDGSLAYTLDDPNPYGTTTWDYFGISVAISDTYAIVGAYQEDDAGGSNSGKAYIYNLSDGSLAYTLDNPNAYSTSASDYFGYSVSISSTHAIVGAQAEDDAGGLSSGKAYIYDLSNGSLAYTLDNPNAYGTSESDNFGFSVSISDTHAIVGAYNEDDAGGSASGKAYIFDLSDGSLAYTLDNPNPYGTSESDRFGYSVSVSTTHAIVGAYFEDDAGGSASGKAYIFDLSDGSLVYTLDNPNAYSTSDSDYFGQSVAISSTHAIVGAYGEDDAGGNSSGKAYIYAAG